MTLNDPKLVLEFLGNDLEAGHSTTQTLTDTEIVRQAITFKQQRYNGLKSSSDTVTMKLRRKCSAVEDIISTEGDIKATLKDGNTAVFTGFISTNFSWEVTDHGDQALNITLESMGTRLFNKDFIETGKYFFDCPAATAVYNIVHPLGITIHSGDERKILQNVQKSVDAGTSCRQLIDELFYECNAVYWFNNLGEICIQTITADTTGAPTYDSAKLRMKDKKVVNLSKKIRTYKGARVAYDELSSARDYLIYRNTTNASATRICNLELPGGCYFDGAEIYTAAEWAAATADTFREPTLISAVNAASESSIVGSGEIVNITNLTENVLKDSEITFTAEAVGGPYFKILAHNTALTTKTIWRMDLSADITFVKSHGVIRTQIDGATDGKSMLEEELSWIHDRENASRHANLLAQYHKYASSTYTFYCNEDITLGSVIKLNDDVYSGLEVYVLVTARQYSDKDDTYTYTAVGVTTFDLTESAYHGTTEEAKQSGAQGPQGEPGKGAEVQYAIGTSLIDPPGDSMQWGGADMLWASANMFWNTGTWENEVPEEQRGRYIWMRTRIGDSPWQYTRLTGSASYDPTFLGAVNSLPTQTPDGLNLIPGDYFVASENFDNDSYLEGFAYVYNGSTWDIMDLEDPTNSPKALECLGGILASGANVTNASKSIWGWFENLVAQNAVLQNLASKQITILNNGCIHSEYYNDDGTIKKTATATTDSQEMTIESFDDEKWFNTVGDVLGTFSWEVTNVWAGGCDFTPIVGNPLPAMSSDDMWDYYGIAIPDARRADYGDTVTVTVISTSGDIYGFWLGADGTFKCHSATAENLRIMGDSVFQGRFDCDVIKTETDTASSVTVSVTDRTRTQGSSIATALQNAGVSSGVKIPVTISGATNPVRFISYSGTDVYFFDENFNKVNIAAYFTVKGYREDTGTTSTETNAEMVGRTWIDKGTYLRYWVNYYIDSNYTITAYNGGNMLTVNIPNSGAGLSFGQLFYGPQTSVGGVTCYPVYMAKGS